MLPFTLSLVHCTYTCTCSCTRIYCVYEHVHVHVVNACVYTCTCTCIQMHSNSESVFILHFILTACNILSLSSSGPYCIVQLETLQQVEVQSGCRVTDLFQWVVACGFGALFLLLIIYGKTHWLMLDSRNVTS